MHKYGLFKACISAALLAVASWVFAAPPPIKRGPLIRGGVKQTAPAKQVPAVKAAPAKTSRGKATPSRKHVPPKAVSSKKPAPPKAAPEKKPPAPPPVVSAATRDTGPRVPYRGAIAVDADSGRVLFADNARTTAYPASVTKLMTFLLVLEDVQAGLYGLDDRAEASELAASMEPSSVGLRPGQSMTIHDLLLSIMVKSANDAAEVLAEHSARRHLLRRGQLPPDVKPFDLRTAFIARMNERARQLGMRDTRYASPNGLPPPPRSKRDFDVSTAVDLVKLGRVVVRTRNALSYTKRASCKVTDGSGKTITLVGHNYFIPKSYDSKHLGTPMPECDGLKTGYTAASGCSIMLTARRNGRRVIVVVLGSRGRHEREKAAGRILRDALDAISIW